MYSGASGDALIQPSNHLLIESGALIAAVEFDHYRRYHVMVHGMDTFGRNFVVGREEEHLFCNKLKASSYLSEALRESQDAILEALQFLQT